MAIEIYDITTDFSDQDIYVDVLHTDTIAAGLTTCTSVDSRVHGNSNKVRFHFPSPLSGPDKTTLDGVVSAYDPVDGLNGIDDDGWLKSILDRDLTAPPGSPAFADRYIVATGGTDDWSGHDLEVTEWNGDAWAFVIPAEHMVVCVDDENRNITWNGSAWVYFETTLDHADIPGTVPGPQQTYGATGDTACEGDDTRLSDARVPTSHTIVSHDTAATGADLDTLVGGGDADSKHTHPIHSLVDGTAAFTGVVGGITPVGGTDLATKGYVDASRQAIEWQDSVKTVTNDPPGSPTTGDRQLVGTVPTGVYVTHANEFAIYNGATWDFLAPTNGTTVTVDTPRGYVNWNGTAWVSLGSGISHGNLIDSGVKTHAEIDTHVDDAANPHDTKVSNLGTSTLAQLNTLLGVTLDVSSASRTPSAHTIESHSGTSVTGAQLTALTDGSNADDKHKHADFDAGTFRVQDGTDATKEMALDVSGITTGTVRTVTVPDADVTIGDAVEIQGKTVSGTTPTTGQLLEYSGSAWVPVTPSGGVYGTEWNFNSDMSDTNTGSTWKLKVRLPDGSGDITLPAGDYELTIGANWYLNTTGGDFEARVQKDDSLLEAVLKDRISATSNRPRLTRIYNFTLTAGDYHFDFDFHSPTGNLASCFDATMSLKRTN